jgi:hypothetical protein
MQPINIFLIQTPAFYSTELIIPGELVSKCNQAPCNWYSRGTTRSRPAQNRPEDGVNRRAEE